MNMGINIWVPVFNSLGCICWRGILGSYGNSWFKFLRNLLILFYERKRTQRGIVTGLLHVSSQLQLEFRLGSAWHGSSDSFSRISSSKIKGSFAPKRTSIHCKVGDLRWRQLSPDSHITGSRFMFPWAFLAPFRLGSRTLRLHSFIKCVQAPCATSRVVFLHTDWSSKF